MAIGSGLAAQLGFGIESVWGTGVTATRFYEFLDESVKLDLQKIQGKGLRGGIRTVRSDKRILNKKGAAGDINLEVTGKNFGILFKHMGLTTVAAPVAAGTGWKHTFTLGDLAGLGLTMQIGRPDTSGVVRPFTYPGTKITDWELGCDVDGILNLKLSTDSQDETTASPALATASYPAANEILTFVGASVTLAGSPFDVSKFSVKATNGLKTDRYYLRGDVKKKEPIVNAWSDLGGELTADFDSLTQYNLFTAGTLGTLVGKFEGSVFNAGNKYTVQVTLGNIQFDGETPNVSGPDLLGITLPFTALDDGTLPPISLDYITTDAAP